MRMMRSPNANLLKFYSNFNSKIRFVLSEYEKFIMLERLTLN